MRPWSALRLTDDDVMDVARKAKELQLEGAEAACVDHCCRRVSPHNAVDWFVRAHQHGLEAGPNI